MAAKKLIIYGAGAIGRGYLPWVFGSDLYEYYFVEANPLLRAKIKERGSYSSYKTTREGYECKKVVVQDCFAPGEEGALLEAADVVATAVGPRNFNALRAVFEGTNFPVICCENDANLPTQMRKWTGNQNVVFAIPDVITSNTASAEILTLDPLAIITEDGEFFVEDRVKSTATGACNYVDEYELNRQWLAKLYIHNTPHCIAAYLGSLLGVTYLHNAMYNNVAAEIVEGAMHEMVSMLKVRSDIKHEFLAYYRDKELARFRNPLLCDPISRVAREPFRKLAPKDRLIGAAQLCLASGVVPDHILIGIMAAFCFESPDDPDAHIRHLRSSMSPSEFLRTIFKLRDSEALFILLVERWDEITRKLEVLKNA